MAHVYESEIAPLQKALEAEKREADKAGWDRAIERLDAFDAEVAAIDCWYRGDPIYIRDANWMKDRVRDMIAKARLLTPSSNSGMETKTEKPLSGADDEYTVFNPRLVTRSTEQGGR